MATLMALGDIAPGDHYFTLGHGLGTRFAAGVQPFAPIAPLLHAADLVIANLEGVLAEASERPWPVESEVFRGPPPAARRLREAGISLAHVANNHVLQHGRAAFRATLRALEEAGVAPLGLPGEGYACAPLIRQAGALSVGFLGYSRVAERYAPGQRDYAAPARDALVADVAALARHVDRVVVSIHWGDEAVDLPAPETIDLARALVDAGASLVLGHHPHVFQPVERHGNGLIAYSLGNVAFDLFWHAPLVESALLRVQLDLSAPDYDLIPVGFDRDYRVRPMAPRAAQRFLDRLDRAAAQMQANAPDYAAFYAARRRACTRVVQRKKLPFFLRNLRRGAARHKAAFLCRKLIARLATP